MVKNMDEDDKSFKRQYMNARNALLQYLEKIYIKYVDDFAEIMTEEECNKVNEFSAAVPKKKRRHIDG